MMVEDIIRTTLQARWLGMREADIKLVSELGEYSYKIHRDPEKLIDFLDSEIGQLSKPRYKGLR